MFATCSEYIPNIILNIMQLGLYWVEGTKSWSFDWPLFIGREGMVDACVNSGSEVEYVAAAPVAR